LVPLLSKHRVDTSSRKPAMTAQWNSDFAADVPIFLPLRAAALAMRCPEWPTVDDFNRALAARPQPVLNAAGRELRFVGQAPRAVVFEDKYEPRIFLRGEVQLRADDWHDVFNALVWLTFPRAKAALNACHFRALEQRKNGAARNRGPAQDALTLFDESGVIVVTEVAELGDMLVRHEWKDLFWRRRNDVSRRMRFYVFGHGLHAKMLHPFTGVTGRGLVCNVAPDFIAQPIDRQLIALDARLAARISGETSPLSARELAPVPLLGVPGWCADNEFEHYYNDTNHFRPLHSAGSAYRASRGAGA
jgi:hypothetical protein